MVRRNCLGGVGVGSVVVGVPKAVAKGCRAVAGKQEGRWGIFTESLMPGDGWPPSEGKTAEQLEGNWPRKGRVLFPAVPLEDDGPERQPAKNQPTIDRVVRGSVVRVRGVGVGLRCRDRSPVCAVECQSSKRACTLGWASGVVKP